MSSKHCEGDSDAKSTLCIIYRIFGDLESVCWQNFAFIPHYAWLGVPIAAVCLFIGVKLHIEDLFVVDKGWVESLLSLA